VLSPFHESLSRKAAAGLADLGVTVREGARATAIDSRGVTIAVDGAEERIPARTVVWAAGVRAVPLAGTLAKAAGAETDRAGRIAVDPELTIPGHPEITVIGDVAKVAGPDGKPLPGLATVAIQQAAHVAKTIRRGGEGPGKPFRYLDKGALAVIGRGRAICEIRGLKISGWPAFATYLGVHLFYLGGEGKRLKLLTDWVTTFFGNRGNQVIKGELSTVERAPPPAVGAAR
jgi:NADH dehydrogenase